MPLIERYVVRRTAYAFFLCLCALVATLWITQVLDQLDVVTAKGGAIWVFVLMTLLALPVLVQVVAPIAFLIAVVFTLNNLTSDGELPVIAAAGASRTAINRPILVFGLFLTLAVAFSYHVVAPASLALLNQLVTRVQSELLTTLVKDGGFRTIDDGLTIHIREKAADGSFRGIFVSDERDPTETQQYSAENGVLLNRGGGSYLVLRHGDVIRDDHRTDETTIVGFDTYALDLSQLGAPNADAVYKSNERSTLYLLDPDPNDTEITPARKRVRYELHKRMTEPLYTLAFAFIALAFLGRPRTNRQDRSLAIAACMALCILLRTGGFLAAAVSKSSAAGLPLLYGLPLAGIAFGLTAIAFDARLSIPEAVETACDRAVDAVRRLMPLRMRAAGGR
jgi:lipopolysaccharide export system permease protein